MNEAVSTHGEIPCARGVSTDSLGTDAVGKTTRKRLKTGPLAVIITMNAWVYTVFLPINLLLPWLLPALKEHGVFGIVWPSRDIPAEQLVRIMTEYRTEYQLIGMIWMAAGIQFLIAACGFAAQVRKMESGVRIYSNIILATAALGCFVMMLSSALWTGMSYSPSLESPHTLKMFYEVFWIFFWISWPPYAVQAIAISIPILSVPKGSETLPRWVAYVSLSSAGLWALFGLAGIINVGNFAYDGWGQFVMLLSFFIESTVVVPLGAGIWIYRKEILPKKRAAKLAQA
ncbi:MAG: hypothetical protein QM769_07315 [Pseudoxanthomonas sp.]